MCRIMCACVCMYIGTYMSSMCACVDTYLHVCAHAYTHRLTYIDMCSLGPALGPLGYLAL